MRIGKSKRWNESTKQWEYYYPATISAAVKDPNFTKSDGKTVMTQGEINQMLADVHNPITAIEYSEIEHKENRPYFIKDREGNLKSIYFGTVCIARKAQDGEQVSCGFPMVFPMIFA